jgi:hypothetical protein
MSDETENRLVRIETRLVKYQEANVQQLMGIHETLKKLVEALNLMNDKEEQDNG